MLSAPLPDADVMHAFGSLSAILFPFRTSGPFVRRALRWLRCLGWWLARSSNQSAGS